MTVAAPPHAPGTPERALAVALAADPPDPAAVHAARLAMLSQWERLQWKQATRWWHANQKRGSLDDYHAAVRAGWWEAAVRFDPARGVGYSAYAGRYWQPWHHDATYPRHSLPEAIYSRLSFWVNPAAHVGTHKNYPDRAAALDALSAACVAYGRQEAAKPAPP